MAARRSRRKLAIMLLAATIASWLLGVLALLVAIELTDGKALDI